MSTFQKPNKNIDNASGQVVREDMEDTLKAVAAHNYGPLSTGGELLPTEFIAENSGTPKKLFTVRLPDGPKWADEKSSIEGLETLGKSTTGTITITYAKHPWYYSNSTPSSEESYTVLCVDFPQWEVFGNQQVRWSGPFVFVEV